MKKKLYFIITTGVQTKDLIVDKNTKMEYVDAEGVVHKIEAIDSKGFRASLPLNLDINDDTFDIYLVNNLKNKFDQIQEKLDKQKLLIHRHGESEKKL